MPSILFVCTANICRSPMAAALFKKKLSQVGHTETWRVESAGTWAVENRPAAPNTQTVIQNRGLDISRHRSKNVSFDLLKSSDLILTMERGHTEALRAEFPQLAGRIYPLSEMAGYEHDIQDPYGSAIEEYEDTAIELESLIDQGFERILQLVKQKD